MKTMIIKTRVFLVLILFSGLALNQVNAQTKLEKGKDLMTSFDYSKAITLFNDYFITAQPTIEDSRDMVECYTNISDTKNAVLWQKKVVAFDNRTARDILNYARLLMAEGQYSEAAEQFRNYASEMPFQKDIAEKWIAACNTALDWIMDPPYVTVANVTALNSVNSEFGLAELNGDYMLTSDRRMSGQSYGAKELTGWTGDPYYKLSYVKKEKDGGFSSSLSLINGLNTEYHCGPAVYNYDNKTVYFTRTKMVKVSKGPVNSDPTSWYDYSSVKEYVNRLEIYSAKYKDDKWTSPVSFEYNKTEEYSIGHPTLSPNGETMYFVSDMPGGYGGSDIYFVEKKADGSWSVPQNAGSKINTEGKEVFPYMDDSGILYYSSDGLPGMGGLDIFSAAGSKNNWSDAVNLKYPINSPKDDFSINFTETGQKGYFASNRDGGLGSDDIYSFEPELRKIVLVGTTKETLDDETSVLLSGVSILLDNTTTGSSMFMTSDQNGKFFSTLECGSDYKVNGAFEGYSSQSEDFTTLCKTRSDTVFVNLDLSKARVNLVVTTKEKLPDGSLSVLSGVNISLENFTTGSSEDLTIDDKGRFLSRVNCGTDYEVRGSKNGYFTQWKAFTPACKTKSDTVFVELVFEKIVINKAIVIENIYYDFDKWNIRPDAAIELDKIVKILTENPQIQIELGSHTDSRGSDEYNQVLSQKRAESAVAYIVSRGIDTGRITAKGYGEIIPVNICTNGVSCSEVDFQKNRRTEFKVTGFIQ